MSKEIQIETPLTDGQIDTLRAGDQVRINGIFYTARDQAHKRLCALIETGQELPVDLSGQVIYFVGPTPAAPGRCIGSAGPTTSSRMDAFSPILIRAGLKGMIGKGYRGEPVRKALQQYKAVHFATLGGAGALLSKHIIDAEIVAYEDLGAEAIRRLYLKDFPAVVAYDAFGGTVYDR
ncbi:MAG: Fe-S-containing hydro-lyase [Sedimentisphaerales bacterium]|nr:Fe-S-containing hydro-lyase [Sedimentisphaerales bacterium]